MKGERAAEEGKGGETGDVGRLDGELAAKSCHVFKDIPADITSGRTLHLI